MKIKLDKLKKKNEDPEDNWDVEEEELPKKKITLTRVKRTLPVMGRRGRGGKGVVTISILPGVACPETSQLLLEVVAMRGSLVEYTIDQCYEYLNTLGRNSFRSIMGDEDRYHQAIYCAEMVRLHGDPTKATEALQFLRLPQFDPKHDPSQEGHVWGIEENYACWKRDEKGNFILAQAL